MKPYLGLIDRYREFLPVSSTTKIVTLYEGNTPLYPLENLVKHLPKKIRLFAKFEGANPTGSFKDRGMTLAITKALEENSHAVICASTGNTSAAAAAYSAKAGLQCFVLIPDGYIALGKLAQAMYYGAKVIQIQGNFDDGMRLVKELGAELPLTIVNSINPYRPQGQKTAAFEIIDHLGEAPDYHCIPVGNAANICAYWQGYKEYQQQGKSTKLPMMCGYQASGSAPFLRGHPVTNPETIATAIRIGNPQSWDRAWQTQQESQGWFAECNDEKIIAAQKLIAAKEGIFCEPASAISFAGLFEDLKNDKIAEGSTVVCTLTGNGLKDPDTAIAQCKELPIKVAAEFNAIKKLIVV